MSSGHSKDALSGTNYPSLSAERLYEICRERKIRGVTERTTRDGLINALKRDDREKEFVAILKGFAVKLGVDTGEISDRLALIALLEPVMVEKLRADKYLTSDGTGKPITVGATQWVLTGEVTTIAGRVEVKARNVTPCTYNRYKKTLRVLYLYHSLYAPDTVPRDTRIVRWLGLG